MHPVIVKNKLYGQGVDWWPLGVMIFEMLTRHPPFYYDERQDTNDDRAQDKLDQKILNDEVDFPEDVTGCHIDCDEALDEESCTATGVQRLKSHRPAATLL
jgi:serine/threonine protein kinase